MDSTYEAAVFLFADGTGAPVWWLHDEEPALTKAAPGPFKVEWDHVALPPEAAARAERRIIGALVKLLDAPERGGTTP